MAHMEPYEAINSLESSLRGLVQDVLKGQWKENSGLDIEELERRRTEEVARRKGATVEQNLLAYTHVYEIRKIIEKNWVKFKPALAEKKRFDVYMDRIEDFRNVPMHSRELLPFEKDLLSGIVGEIRNLATLYRSQQAPDRKYYPIVESVVDSFGTEIDPTAYATRTNIRLQVGQQVTFACRGWDPEDRTLEWRIWTLPGRQIDSVKGNPATLTWSITGEHVNEDFQIYIQMQSSGKYHRSGTYDFLHVVHYSVDPPERDQGDI